MFNKGLLVKVQQKLVGQSATRMVVLTFMEEVRFQILSHQMATVEDLLCSQAVPMCASLVWCVAPPKPRVT